MLALHLNNNPLTLARRQAANINLVNPFFDQDGAERLYTFPFELENTPENLEALRHANRLDRRGDAATLTGAELYLEGQLFATGILDLNGQSYTQKTIKVVFKNEVPDFLEELEKIKIDEILETVTSSVSPPDAVWSFNFEAPPQQYLIRIDGVQVVVSTTESATLTLSEVITLLVSRINAIYPGMASGPWGGTEMRLDAEEVEDHPVNFYSAAFILASITTPGQSALQGFINHVNAINATPVDTHSFPALNWPGFYAGSNLTYRNWVNLIVGGTAITINAYAEQPAWEATYVPFVKLPYLLTRIVAATPGLSSYAGHLADDADLQQLLIFNNMALDELQQNYYDADDQRWINKMKATIDLNEHVPELTAREAIDRITLSFALWYEFQGSRLIFHRKKAQLEQPPVDWTGRTEPTWSGERRKQEGIDLGYEENEDRYTDPSQLQRKTIGLGGKKIDLPFSSLLHGDRSAVVAPGTVKAPSLFQAGSSLEGGLGDNDYTFRLFFDRGMQPSSDGDDYHLGGHDTTNYDGDPVGTISLDLNAADSFYHTYLKGVLQLLTDGEPVTIGVRLTAAELIKLRSWKNTRRIITLPEGQVTCIIRSVQFKASAERLSIAKVVLVKEP